MNSDQGSQFTSGEFTEKLEKAGIKISRDGRGRVCDNIFIERLWRTVKYEEVYIHSYDTVKEARESLDSYFRFYNNERLHQSLGYRTPQEVYFGKTINKQEEIIHLKSLFSVLTMGSTLSFLGIPIYEKYVYMIGGYT